MSDPGYDVLLCAILAAEGDGDTASADELRAMADDPEALAELLEQVAPDAAAFASDHRPGEGPPPFAGAVYDKAIHRWVKGGTEGGGSGSGGTPVAAQQSPAAPAPVEPAKPTAPSVTYPAGYRPPKAGSTPNPKAPQESRPNLTAEQANECQRYSIHTYRPLNDAARSGKPPKGEVAVADAHLQAAFARAEPFAEPVTVLRGFGSDPGRAKQLEAYFRQCMESGTDAVLPDYQSTSTGIETRPDGAFPGIMQYTIKATHGLDLRPYSDVPHENEILLNRGSSFVVKKVEIKNGQVHVELEQRPPTRPADPNAVAAKRKSLFGKLFGG